LRGRRQRLEAHAALPRHEDAVRLPQAEETSAGSEAAAKQERMKGRTPRVDWAEVLKRTFNFDVFACMRCGGRRRVLAYGKGAGGVRAILEHLGLPRPVRTWPRAWAAPERLVLKLKPPQPAKKARPLPCPAWEGGWAELACVCWR